jgi:hypothetical protein
MRTCPYCGQQALTARQKATLGPVRSVPCQSCGKRVSVSPLSVLAGVPFLLGIGAVWYFRASPLGIAALIVGAVAMFVIHEYAVPLVRRDA